jgi:flagellar hook-basal body complex protein FliE
MSDPLGFISGAGRVQGTPGVQGPGVPASIAGGPSFKDVLLKNIDEVNRLQQDANAAAEDLMAGRRDDPEQVMTAIAKADLAFKTLQAVRNQVMRAYDEVQQMRV